MLRYKLKTGYARFASAITAKPCAFLVAVFVLDSVQEHTRNSLDYTTGKRMTLKLRPQQEQFENAIRAAFQSHRTVLGVASTGFGKCLGRGTPVMLSTGEILPVERVQAGDCLMGPDSKPRTVLAITQGIGELYRVSPVKGEPFVCNGEHILNLKMSGVTKYGTQTFSSYPRNGIGCVEISVNDYLRQSKGFKHCGKLIRAPVEFGTEYTLDLDPYFLGLWLGDGTSIRPEITTIDPEVVMWLTKYADECGLSVRVCKDKNCPTYAITSGKEKGRAHTGSNRVLTSLQVMGLIGNKHIPLHYKTSSRLSRLRLLAGLVDSDGYVFKNNIEIVTKIPRLADDILFLARSLGLAAYSKFVRKTCTTTGISDTYTLIGIFGAGMDDIPTLLKRKQCFPRLQKKDALVDGIASVEQVGLGDYYGFQLDGDGLFLLGDFTVTHNSVVIADMCYKAAEKGRKVLVVTNRRVIVNQLREHCGRTGIRTGVIMASEETDKDAIIQVASIQTLKRRNFYGLTEPGFVILDEAHNEVVSYSKLLHERFHSVPALGLTATPCGPGGTKLAHFETVVEPIKNSEVIAVGDLLRVAPYLAPSEPDLGGIDLERASKDEVGDRVQVCTVFSDVFKEWEPYSHMQTLAIFPSRAICNGFLQECLKRGISAKVVDGTTRQDERDDTFSEFKELDCKMILGVDVIREGLDLPIAQCLIDLHPTHQFRVWWQAIGRIKRPHPGQESAVVIDLAGNLHRHMIHPDQNAPWDELTNDKTIEEIIERKAGVRCPKCGSKDIYSCELGYRCEDCGETWTTKKPWVCPSCKQALSPWQKVTDGKCPNCGSVIGQKPLRRIRFADGSLREFSCDEIKRRKKCKSDSEQAEWLKWVFIAHNWNRKNPDKRPKTLAWCRVMFQKKQGHWPREGMKYMPVGRNHGDWQRSPSSVFPWLGHRKQTA